MLKINYKFILLLILGFAANLKSAQFNSKEEFDRSCDEFLEDYFKNLETAKTLEELLFEAIDNANIVEMMSLFERGADFFAINKNGETPLIFASKKGNFHVVRFLTFIIKVKKQAIIKLEKEKKEKELKNQKEAIQKAKLQAITQPNPIVRRKPKVKTSATANWLTLLSSKSIDL